MKKALSLLLAACVTCSAPTYAAAVSFDACPTQNSILYAESGITVQPRVGGYYEIVIPNAPGASKVQVRSWTDANGKDDLITDNAIHRENGVWCAAVSTARHGGGNMTSEVYADGRSIGTVAYAAPVPAGACILPLKRMASFYSILVSNVPTASSVRVAVGSSTCSQKDMVWYDANYSGDGVWSVLLNTAGHCGGDMICAVYADGAFQGTASFTAPRTEPVVRTERTGGTRYDVVVENLWGAADVQVPTWGEAGGQDDVIWYTAANTEPGTWRASINAASHDEGTICSHVYADGTAVQQPVYVHRSFLQLSDDTGTTRAPDLSGLSRKMIGWGHGGPKDASGRPEAATDAQAKYECYEAGFIAPQSNRIYLTFDEGYENGNTSRILDVLKEKQVKSVFFVTAPYVAENPELVQRMIDEGHIVGNHSTTHPSMPKLSDEKAFSDIMRLHHRIQEQFGYDMRLFRAPSGEYCERDLALAQALGYRHVFWSFAYMDYEPTKQIGSAAALKKVKRAMHPGAIYLLHAVSSDNAGMLADFIDYCRDSGYELPQYSADAQNAV